MKKLLFITSNLGKVQETKKKFESIGISIVQKNLGYPEIQADSLEEVAISGCQWVQSKIHDPFILEDAGLFIDALHGFPGVYSSYVYHTIGLQGVLDLLQSVEIKKRTATFRSVYAYQEIDKDPHLFIGECQGIITAQMKGAKGFGYDPIFLANGVKKTFAEMSTDEKNTISHRGASLAKLLEFLKK